MSRAPRALNPVDRLSEILFGLIMVLTFTGSLSIAEVGHEDVRLMLIGALGCNIAWGIIDAVLFLMGALAERNEGLTAWNAARRAGDPQTGRDLVAGALPPVVASVMTADELESIRQRLVALPSPPPRAGLEWSNWRGAIGVFLLVVVTTFPVVVPFLLSSDARWALRMSNAIALAMLFITGYLFAKLTGRSPWVAGILMVFLGAALVAMTMALGG